jgi:cytochrome c-type biogenesis protein CcmH
MRQVSFFGLLLWASVCIAIDPLPFADQKQEKRFQALTAELRCLQCQNQNLADSDAGLAKDMRAQVLLMMQKGESDQQIKKYMVDRYGDFVVYTPPFNWQNMLLWLLPMFAVLGGLMFVLVHFRSRFTSAAGLHNNNDKAPAVDAGDNW